MPMSTRYTFSASMRSILAFTLLGIDAAASFYVPRPLSSPDLGVSTVFVNAYKSTSITAKTSGTDFNDLPIPDLDKPATITGAETTAPAASVTDPAPIIDKVVPQPSSGLSVEDVVSMARRNYEGTISNFRDAPRSPGQAPLLSDFVKEQKIPTELKPENIVNELKNLKSLNFDALKEMKISENMDNLVRKAQNIDKVDINQFKDTATAYWSSGVQKTLDIVPIQKMGSSIRDFISLTKTNGWSFLDAAKALDIDELGPWYLGILGFLTIFSVSQRAELESKLDETTKKLNDEANTAEDKVKQLLTEKEKMARQVSQLSETTEKVSKELMKAQADKSSSEDAMAALKNELDSIQKRFETQQADEQSARSMLAEEVNTRKREMAELESRLAESKQAEDALRVKIKTLESDLQAAQAAAEKAAVEKAAAERLASEKAAAEAEKAATQKAATTEQAVTESAPKAESKSKTASKKTSSKSSKKASSKSASRAETESSAGTFFSAVETSPDAPSVSSSKGEDWSKLAKSTLQRKTVKELKEYLKSKVSFQCCAADHRNLNFHTHVILICFPFTSGGQVKWSGRQSS